MAVVALQLCPKSEQMRADVYKRQCERFLTKLEGIADPEQKRKIIGAEFIRVFEEEARKLEGIDFLAQGTIYPDIVESGTKTAKVVKSHHNVGGLPEDMKFDLVEPLYYLFKDEVRACGLELGLPHDMVSVSYTHLDVYKRQGLGCNVPAVMATRVIEEESSRRRTALVVPLISCGARLPIYLLFAAAFFPGQGGLVVFTLYGLSLVSALVLSLVLDVYKRQ